MSGIPETTSGKRRRNDGTEGEGVISKTLFSERVKVVEKVHYSLFYRK